uniref:Uncharacterized protein n=1 Tax=Anopheles darlingi TaxID=43151 RepID=A0A2M4CKZ1_ANODA
MGRGVSQFVFLFFVFFFICFFTVSISICYRYFLLAFHLYFLLRHIIFVCNVCRACLRYSFYQLFLYPHDSCVVAVCLSVFVCLFGWLFCLLVLLMFSSFSILFSSILRFLTVFHSFLKLLFWDP